MNSQEHPDLVAIRRRYRRASDHTVEVNDILRVWVQRNDPHKILSEYDNETGEVVFRVVVTEPLPSLEIGVLLSDMVNQLRSCLDNLWWSCRMSFGDRNPKGNFPIFYTPEEWAKLVSDHGRRWDKDFILAISKVQPFHLSEDGSHPHRLNDPLVQLSKLSNKDKHKSLRIVAPSPGTGFRVNAPVDVSDITQMLEADGVFLRWDAGTAFEMETLWHDDEFTLLPCIQIPGANYFPGLGGEAGVVARMFDLVNDLISDLGPFIKGERPLDYDPHDRSLDHLKWTVSDVQPDDDPRPWPPPIIGRTG